MIGRSVTGSLIPRAINSEPSNPSPIFSPSTSGGPTIFVNAGGATAPPATESQAPLPADAGTAPVNTTNPTEPVVPAIATSAPEPEAIAAVRPNEEAAEPTQEPAVEEPVARTPILDVPTAMPVMDTLSPAVEAQKDAPVSSAVHAAASAFVAGVVTIAAFVV
jgi:hypothetical protein